MERKKKQTYNDGICTVYAVDSEDNLTAKIPGLRYEERTVGVTRHYEAHRASEQIDMVIRVPHQDTISVLDICKLTDGNHCRIKQVQHPRGVAPASDDLALERMPGWREYVEAEG